MFFLFGGGLDEKEKIVEEESHKAAGPLDQFDEHKVFFGGYGTEDRFRSPLKAHSDERVEGQGERGRRRRGGGEGRQTNEQLAAAW
eukprot:CAMPEP_0113893766 /NCGR_PEP_ID=MMETSP0780_2-20120614/16292_1 /TAXON_ID=652834 /ORGANISM="Palpitomonas bilix" /LENGTH=85 /DNA_ID=CAMNT_0000884127 /DNA_START=140 /DNA_END=394 /DNA_ORIENTATION=- /assembly_acc=CAM_ASM_000599